MIPPSTSRPSEKTAFFLGSFEKLPSWSGAVATDSVEGVVDLKNHE